MYIRKLYRFKNAIEIEEHVAGRFGAPGMKRRAKEEPSREQVLRHNHSLKVTRCRRKLRAHFRENDYFVTLTYKRELRPEGMQQAKADLKAFLRRLREAYREKGAVLKWIANVEVGTKNAWHVHMVINRAPDADIAIRKAWKHGRINFQLLHEQGEFRDLAAYMTKTPLTDPKLKEASYHASHGLDIPEPKVVKHLGRFTPLSRLKPPEGWYIDQDSVVEGESLFTGTPYRKMTLLRLRRREDE